MTTVIQTEDTKEYHRKKRYELSLKSLGQIPQLDEPSYLDNGNLDKKAVGNRTFDLLDSTRLALKMFEKSEKR